MARIPVRDITASTDRNPSVVRRLADAFASQLAALWEQLQATYKNWFVETEAGPRRWLGPISAAVVVTATWWIANRRRRRC
jgi:hypothetical protein